jgi:hypothetical protein
MGRNPGRRRVFSRFEPSNQYAERIRITDDSAGKARFDPRALARLIIFLLVTAGISW